jgi:ATP-dependent RNA helicase DeaD
MQQRQRDAAMNRFRSEKADLLIATEVAARGLDVAQLSHVFTYDLPSAPDVYVHRIGRTGEPGREGTAITLVEQVFRRGDGAIQMLVLAQCVDRRHPRCAQRGKH